MGNSASIAPSNPGKPNQRPKATFVGITDLINKEIERIDHILHSPEALEEYLTAIRTDDDPGQERSNEADQEKIVTQSVIHTMDKVCSSLVKIRARLEKLKTTLTTFDATVSARCESIDTDDKSGVCQKVKSHLDITKSKVFYTISRIGPTDVKADSSETQQSDDTNAELDRYKKEIKQLKQISDNLEDELVALKEDVSNKENNLDTANERMQKLEEKVLEERMSHEVEVNALRAVVEKQEGIIKSLNGNMVNDSWLENQKNILLSMKKDDDELSTDSCFDLIYVDQKRLTSEKGKRFHTQDLGTANVETKESINYDTCSMASTKYVTDDDVPLPTEVIGESQPETNQTLETPSDVVLTFKKDYQSEPEENGTEADITVTKENSESFVEVTDTRVNVATSNERGANVGNNLHNLQDTFRNKGVAIEDDNTCIDQPICVQAEKQPLYSDQRNISDFNRGKEMTKETSSSIKTNSAYDVKSERRKANKNKSVTGAYVGEHVKSNTPLIDNDSNVADITVNDESNYRHINNAPVIDEGPNDTNNTVKEESNTRHIKENIRIIDKGPNDRHITETYDKDLSIAMAKQENISEKPKTDKKTDKKTKSSKPPSTDREIVVDQFSIDEPAHATVLNEETFENVKDDNNKDEVVVYEEGTIKEIMYKRNDGEIDGNLAYYKGVGAIIRTTVSEFGVASVQCIVTDAVRNDMLPDLVEGERPISFFIHIKKTHGLHIDIQDGDSIKVFIPHRTIPDHEEATLVCSVNGQDWEQCDLLDQMPASLDKEVQILGTQLRDITDVKMVAIAREKAIQIIAGEDDIVYQSQMDPGIRVKINTECFPARCGVTLMVHHCHAAALPSAVGIHTECRQILDCTAFVYLVCEKVTAANMYVLMNLPPGADEECKFTLFLQDDAGWKLADCDWDKTSHVLTVHLMAGMRKYRIIGLELPNATSVEERLMAIQYLHRHISHYSVQVICRQNKADPTKTIILCVRTSLVEQGIAQLQELGYSVGGAQSEPFCLLDGDKLTIECTGDIVATPHKSTRMEMLFHSQKEIATKQLVLCPSRPDAQTGTPTITTHQGTLHVVRGPQPGFVVLAETILLTTNKR